MIRTDERQAGIMGTEIARRASSELAEKVVQVRIAGATARRTYAYQVPFELDLEVGDWVTLPGNVVSEHGGFGIIKAFGREGYNGPLKSIRTKIPEPPELMIRMSVVKTKDRAAEIYDAAVAEGWTGDRLTALAVIGDQRLRARGVR
jgi:hypothetical protein